MMLYSHTKTEDGLAQNGWAWKRVINHNKYKQYCLFSNTTEIKTDYLIDILTMKLNTTQWLKNQCVVQHDYIY